MAVDISKLTIATPIEVSSTNRLPWKSTAPKQLPASRAS